MGLNIVIGCHRHKQRYWIYRGHEKYGIGRFYREHWKCAHMGSVSISDDQASVNWVDDPSWTENEVEEPDDVVASL